MKQVNIYALINPLNNDVFYIGATSRALKTRLADHVYEVRRNNFGSNKKAAKIEQLLEIGAEPEILHLDTVDLSDASFFEEFYIQLFISYGFTLLQVRNSTFTKASITKEKKIPIKSCHPASDKVRQIIKKAMKTEGIKQGNLATLLNMPDASVSRLLNGPHELDVNTIRKIAAAINYTFSLEFVPRQK